MVNESKLELWRSKGLTLRDRLGHPPVIQRSGIDQDVLDEKLGRGDLSQKIRLRVYPSIEVNVSDMYAGSVRASLPEVEDMLYQIGFRNNPTAYVEITDRLGPDDGSYSRQFITEDDEFPYLGIGRPFGVVTWWNRLKLQYHVTTFKDGEMVHMLCHMEASAWLQPARHVSISEADGKRGARDFREFWEDEFGEKLDTPLGAPANRRR